MTIIEFASEKKALIHIDEKKTTLIKALESIRTNLKWYIGDYNTSLFKRLKGTECSSGFMKLIEELGILVPGLSYNQQVINAVDKRPDCFEKIYIPETVRRSNEWIKDLDLFSSYGLW